MKKNIKNTKVLSLFTMFFYIFNIAVILNFTSYSIAFAGKSDKRCSEWGASNGKDCNGDLMYDWPMTRGKIMAVGNDPFNMKYKVYTSACYVSWVFASDGCLYDFPGGDSHTFEGGKSIVNYSAKGNLTCDTGLNSWSSVCIYRVNTNGDKPPGFNANNYGNVNTNAFICAFAVPAGFVGNFASGNWNNIGCVPEPLLPGPPTFNKIVLGSSYPYVIQPQGDLTKWFNSINSTFDNPGIQLKRDTDDQSLNLNYNFDNAANAQDCKRFPGEVTYYCPYINPSHPNEICVYKSYNISNSSGNQTPDSTNTIGCVPRPGVEQASSKIFVSDYSTFIAKDGSLYQGIIPIEISGATKGMSIGKDSNGQDDIMIGENYVLYKVGATNVLADCSLLSTYQIKQGKQIESSKICQLNSNVILKIAEYDITLSMYNNNNSYLPYNDDSRSIREYILFKTTDTPSTSTPSPNTTCTKCGQFSGTPNYIASYMIDKSSLKKYQIKLSAIIPEGTNNITQKYAKVNQPAQTNPPILSNCSLYEDAMNNEPGATAYIPASSSRDNKYCLCDQNSSVSTDKYMCPKNDNYKPGINDSCCFCQVCYNTSTDITKLVCPGVYDGRANSATRDNICLYSNDQNWDFITGKSSIGNNKVNLSLICSPIPDKCLATDAILNTIDSYDAGNLKNGGGKITKNYAIPNLGNASWPEGNVDEKKDGICANNFTYKYQYSFHKTKIKTEDYIGKNGMTTEGDVEAKLKTAQNDFDNAIKTKEYIAKSDLPDSSPLAIFKDAIFCPKNGPKGKCIGGVYKIVPSKNLQGVEEIQECIEVDSKTDKRGADQYTGCDPDHASNP